MASRMTASCRYQKHDWRTSGNDLVLAGWLDDRVVRPLLFLSTTITNDGSLPFRSHFGPQQHPFRWRQPSESIRVHISDLVVHYFPFSTIAVTFHPSHSSKHLRPSRSLFSIVRNWSDFPFSMPNRDTVGGRVISTNEKLTLTMRLEVVYRQRGIAQST